jgi:hypothetical protein
MEARGGIEPPMMVLQTIALPLGDRATEQNEIWNSEGRERRKASPPSSLLCTTNFCRSHLQTGFKDSPL